jgi:hypothetical protein
MTGDDPRDTLMIEKVQKLVLAALSALVMCAIGAPAASGVSFHSDAPDPSIVTILTGQATGNHVIHAAGSSLTCTGASFEGRQVGSTAVDLTLTAAYSGCTATAFGFKIGTLVNMGGCAYTFNANGEVGIVDNPSAAKTCAEEPITYRISNFAGECDIRIDPQNGLKSAAYDGTTTANGDITLTPSLIGIKGTAKGNLCTEGEFTNGAYTTGPITLKGYEALSGAEGEQVAIWWN